MYTNRFGNGLVEGREHLRPDCSHSSCARNNSLCEIDQASRLMEFRCSQILLVSAGCTHCNHLRDAVMTSTLTPKEERIAIRIAPEAKVLLRRAAQRQHTSLSHFIVGAVLDGGRMPARRRDPLSCPASVSRSHLQGSGCTGSRYS